MYIERLTLSGVKYVITHHDDGSVTQEPPLPESAKKRFKKNHKEIVETGKFPGMQTDTLFHAGRGSVLDQFQGDEEWTRFAMKKAKKAGVSVSSDSLYFPTLADEPADPKAFIRPDEGRAELKRRFKQKAERDREKAQRPAPKLSKKLTNEMVNYYRSTGEAAGMSSSELKQMVQDKHGRRD